MVTVDQMQKGEGNKDLKPILRQATGRDLAQRQHWQEKETEALDAANETVAQLKLNVKIVTAEYTFDGRQLTILYTTEDADEKKQPNLGKLQQRLRRALNSRVELRRIGPRDHAKLLDGYGACGELRCCSRFLADFSPVSIKMAKVQGVSLNPAEITGMCGRLRCCLMYEQDQYEDACKLLPRRKKRVRTPFGEGKVVDLLPLKGVVVVQLEDRRLEISADEVELI